MQAEPHREPQEIVISVDGVLDIREIGNEIHCYVFSTFEAALRGGMDSKMAFEIFSDRARMASCPGNTCMVKTTTTKVWCDDQGCSATTGCKCHLWRKKSVPGGTQTDDLGATDEDHPKRREAATYWCKCQ